MQYQDLEELKRQAKIHKRKKELDKALDFTNPDNVQPTDIMLVLHKDEVDALEDVILNVLSGEPIELTRLQKRTLVDIIKHIQGDEDNE